MVVFFTGAGLSAESGIPTFRDKDGLWEGYDINVVCNYNTLDDNLLAVSEFYNMRRAALKDAEQNKTHYEIAKLQKQYGSDEVVVLTQNIDDLLERAGCSDVIHLHGELTKMMCRRCDAVWSIGYEPASLFKRCPDCKGKIKPSVVFFNEMAPMYTKMHKILDSIDAGDTIVVIGTSGRVLPLSQIVGFLSEGCQKIICNLEKGTDINYDMFDHSFIGAATEMIDDIKPYLKRSLPVG